MSSPDESEYSIDDKLTVGAVIAPVSAEVAVISKLFVLIKTYVAFMLALAVILLHVVMLPLCMALCHAINYDLLLNKNRGIYYPVSCIPGQCQQVVTFLLKEM